MPDRPRYFTTDQTGRNVKEERPGSRAREWLILGFCLWLFGIAVTSEKRNIMAWLIRN